MLSKTKNRSQYYIEYLIYTTLFILLSFIIFLPFRLSNKSFVWNIDGINQHFPSILYYSNWLKDIFSGNGITMVDFKIGMGFDVITTLSYYAIGDPITMLVGLFRVDSLETVYKYLIILRFYLAGVCFIAYCFYMKQRGLKIVLGALIYVFCGYALYAGVRHPYFLNPMIYLPILLIGMEQVLRKRRPFVLVIGVFISAISNFYFLYMLSILIFLYGVVRYFYHSREWIGYETKNKVTVLLDFIKTFTRGVLYYLLGIVMSAFLLLPVIISFLNIGRFDTGYDVKLLHYNLNHYISVMKALIAPNIYPGHWTRLTFQAFIPISIALVLINNKRKELRDFFIIGTLMLLVPAFGYVMNGFAYVSNRWEFGYGFLVAFIFVMTYEDLFKQHKYKNILLILGLLGYGGIAIKSSNIYVMIGLAFLTVSVFAVFVLSYFKASKAIINLIVLIIVVGNLGVNGFLTYHSKYGNYVGEFINAGKVLDTIEDSPVSLIKEIDDDSFYRIETFGDSKHNESLSLSYHDVAGYFSMMDKRVPEYFNGLELLNLRTAYRFDDLDYRTTLGTLASVKYIVTKDKNMAPFGYEVIKEVAKGDKTYYLLYNKNYLPLAYVYDSYIQKEDYDKLHPIDKQEIMLSSIVLNEDLKDSNETEYKEQLKKEKELVFASKLDINLEPNENLLIVEGGIKVLKKGAKLRISYLSEKNCETYLRLENVNINHTPYYYIDVKVKGEGEVTKTINIRSNKNNSYFAKENYIVNLGYSTKERSYLELTFNNKGTFNIGELSVYNIPMNVYESRIADLSQNVLTDVRINKNTISGKVSLDKDGILCLTIPYSKGFKATVNNREVEILEGNIMYMAIPLEAGEQFVELSYETPFLRIGCILSIGGFILFLVLILSRKLTQLKAERNDHNGENFNRSTLL